ncbi:MAG TPA: HD domain-containing protein [Deltaproteobacteria bacterium]|nr:HD domain-containing protein [Deltaproteobacteria bacterium]HQB37918.1 HD domain-containing protein [Deltaproteobacteria bacterium]
MTEQISDIIGFVRHIMSAITNTAMYSSDHPQVTRLTELACESINRSLHNQPHCSLMVINSELIIDGQAQEHSIILNRFSQLLESLGLRHIKLQAGIEKQEIADLIKALSRRRLDTAASISSSAHIRLGQLEVAGQDDKQECSGTATHPDQQKQLTIQEIPKAEMERFKDIYEHARHHNKLKINGINEIVSSVVDVYRQESRSLLALAVLRNKDEYTFTHTTNVSILNIAQASALGIQGQLLNDIGVAGMLHDIGKLFIPEEILNKDDALTDSEMEIMKSHPVKGARYLLDAPGVPRIAVINAYEHHLRHDLSGYPQVPDNWRQSLCSQITAVSDVFDALRTRRTYRPPLDFPHVAQIMLDMMGTHLHPILVKNLLNIISNYAEN